MKNKEELDNNVVLNKLEEIKKILEADGIDGIVHLNKNNNYATYMLGTLEENLMAIEVLKAKIIETYLMKASAKVTK